MTTTPPNQQPNQPGHPGRRWERSVTWFGLVFSLSAHLLLLVLALLIHGPARGTGGVGKHGEVSLAIVPHSTISENILNSDSASLISADALLITDAIFELSLVAPSEAIELAGLQGDTSGVPLNDLGLDALTGFSGTDGADLMAGAAMPGAAGGGTTSFFGLEARGSRIVYVVDISGSMNTSGRMGTLQNQLIGSISELPEHGHFCVVTFHSESRTLLKRGWTPSTEANKKAVNLAIRALQASGGTMPLTAFQSVFELSPRPDAIYFMTDGEFQTVEHDLVLQIEQWNKNARRPTPVYCITFGTDVAREVMRRIAERSGGSYAHVEAK